jgi:trehalose/maltose transport system substrate-binding protein
MIAGEMRLAEKNSTHKGRWRLRKWSMCFGRASPHRRSCRFARVPALSTILVFLVILAGCKKQTSEPVTLTLLDQGEMTRDFLDKQDELIAQFTKETGIRVKILPAPETSLEQLAFWQKLLSGGSKSPDVYGVDIIWPPALDEYLMDLKPYLEQDTSAHFPMLVANYTVNGKLVALPYHANTGALFYRTDLLQEYGYREPPKTWSELERMATKIQAGERAAGKTNFWGFVWQGVAAEALTCNALEWQVSEGGGSIIEEDGTISVNNPRAIRSWERAAHWVGTISPPGVLAYGEPDAYNLWLSGDAAFMRNWAPAFRRSQALGSPIRAKFDLTLLPGDNNGRAGTIGGSGLGVSRFSGHPRESIALIRFLCRRDIEMKWSREFSEPPTLVELYDAPEILEANPYLARLRPSFEKDSVMRPAKIAGRKYPEVSTAYFRAVHSVLTKEKSAATAAKELEEDLARITGFRKGSSAQATPKPN